MRYLSVCSGIEAASAAWHPLGWEAAAFSEIEAFPRAVLKHHYPTVHCHGDFTTIGADDYGAIDVLVGGTPCQDFSVAGLRAGVAGERGNLTLEFLRLAARKKPRWIVWENVPGVLSIDDGRTFGAVLGGLAELGYGFAYRILDAQHFGLAQRRARVFVVGYLGDWRRAAAVLFERESLQGHPAPSRETREGIAPTISARTRGGVGLGTDFDCDGGLIAKGLSASRGRAGELAPTLRSGGHDKSHANGGVMPAIAFQSKQSATAQGPSFDELAPALDIAKAGGTAVAFESRFARNGRGAPDTVVPPLKAQSGQSGKGDAAPLVAFNITPSQSNKDYNARQSERAQALAAGGNRPSARGGDVIVQTAVRRLTPRECERLQGFPDDYTLVPYRGKPAADGPRYKALGNSMAVPVMRWIGERIKMVESLS